MTRLFCKGYTDDLNFPVTVIYVRGLNRREFTDWCPILDHIPLWVVPQRQLEPVGRPILLHDTLAQVNDLCYLLLLPLFPLRTLNQRICGRPICLWSDCIRLLWPVDLLLFSMSECYWFSFGSLSQFGLRSLLRLEFIEKSWFPQQLVRILEFLMHLDLTAHDVFACLFKVNQGDFIWL